MIDPVIIPITMVVTIPLAAPLLIFDTPRLYLLGVPGRVKPIVRLVADMLDVGAGWKDDGYSEIAHSTGARIGLRYDGFIKKLSVDGSDVPLSPADKLCLHRAYRRIKKHRSAIEQERAAKLLAERAQAFATRAERFADTVVPFEKRA